MKTFQIVTLFAMIAASMAFAPNAPKGEYALFFLRGKMLKIKPVLSSKDPRWEPLIGCSIFPMIAGVWDFSSALLKSMIPI